MPQQYLNNFRTVFLDPIPASTGTSTFRVARPPGGPLDSPLALNDYFVMTAYRIVNGREVDHEVMHITAVDRSQPGAYVLTAKRAQELIGSAVVAPANAYGMNDHIEARWTAESARRTIKTDETGAAGLALLQAGTAQQVLTQLGLGNLTEIGLAVLTATSPGQILSILGITAGGIPLGIIGAPVGSATAGQIYSGFAVAAYGGIAPYRYSIGAGSLPVGLSLNETTGTVSGVPTTAGTWPNIVIHVTDQADTVAALPAFAVVVATGVQQIAISGTPPTTATVGVAYNFAPVATGGAAPRSFSVASGTLPAGLTLNATTGAITGAPTATGTSTGIVIRVTDSLGNMASLPAFSIAVTAGVAQLTISGTPATSVIVGSAYSFTPTASGGVAPRTFALVAGTLPAGLVFNPANGSITGTASSIATATGLSIRVTDSSGTAATLPAFSIAVTAVPVDSRARFGYGAANAAQLNPQTLFDGMTVVPGATNGTKSGTFTGEPPNNAFVWVVLDAVASASGARFTGPLGPGGFQGTAEPTGDYLDDPGLLVNTSTVVATINGVSRRFFRSNSANAANTWTIS